MKFGIITFPGSNCDQDMITSLSKELNQEVVSLWHKDTSIQNCDAIIVPGGFSYGDYLRSGAIARFSPIMNNVIEFANNGGFVLGVCNGFQILCEAGLLPGTLLHNTSHKFISKNCYIKATSNALALTKEITSKSLKIPIAHGEGRYYIDDQSLNKMFENDQITFQYCDQDGKLTDQSNPNGSVQNIAGVCNLNKNVFGMMPHPERATSKILGNIDGKEIFDSLISYLSKKVYA